ncbi:MAG: hypothetical protein ACYTFG_07790, partial [Planctomycetota bacterium]
MKFRILVFVLIAGFAFPAFALDKSRSTSKPEKIGARIPSSARKVTISNLDGEPEKWEGKRVLVEGLIERQCGHGMWFWIGSEEGAENVDRYKCGCSGKAWEQPQLLKKICPFCGPAMPNCGTKVGSFSRARHRVYVVSREIPITPRLGRRVRVYGIVSLPKRKNPGPWIVPRGIEILPAEPKPVRKFWKCACTGKTWEQEASEKKACPYCGPAMSRCGTLVKVIRGQVQEPEFAAGCRGCDPETKSGGCGGCGGGESSAAKERCSEENCANCRGDDPNKLACSPVEKGASSERPALAAKTQTLCPVMGGPVNKNVFSIYKGLKVYFCCPGCDRRFEQDPEEYIRKMRASGVEP